MYLSFAFAQAVVYVYLFSSRHAVYVFTIREKRDRVENSQKLTTHDNDRSPEQRGSPKLVLLDLVNTFERVFQ